MKRKVQKLKIKKSRIGMAVSDLAKALVKVQKKTPVYMDVGGPIVRLMGFRSYKKGINDEPTFVMVPCANEFPKPTAEQECSRDIANMIMLYLEKEGWTKPVKSNVTPFRRDAGADRDTRARIGKARARGLRKQG
jgi:hypothetical protein